MQIHNTIIFNPVINQLNMDRVKLEIDNIDNWVKDSCNPEDCLGRSCDCNKTEFSPRIQIPCKGDLDGAEAVTFPTEENQDRVSDSTENRMESIQNDILSHEFILQPVNRILDGNGFAVSSNELKINTNRFMMNQVDGIRRSLLRSLQSSPADQESQVVKLDEGYINFGYWLLILVGFGIIISLMLPDSKV